MRVGRTACAVACALVIAGTARATPVNVTVRERGGSLVEGAWLELRPEGDASMRYNWNGGRTDIQGLVRIDLAEGRWSIDVVRCDDPALVLPKQNPRAPPAIVNVGATPTEATIELWRGRRIRHVLSANRPAPGVSIHPRSTDGFQARDAFLSERSMTADDALLPGRWVFVPEIPAGWLLTGVSVDGEPIAAAQASIEVEPGPSTLMIEWTIEGQSVLAGHVASTDASPCGSPVTAHLAEPGPWFDAARARGGSTFDVVTAFVSPRTCDFEMIVPSGTWSLAVGAPDAPCEQDPPATLAQAASGTTTLVTLRASCGGRGGQGAAQDGAPLVVRVVDPDGRPLDGAVVEAHATGPEIANQPERIEETDAQGYARFRAEAGKPWRLVAGHAEHLDEALAVEKWMGVQTGSDLEAVPTITLRRASRLRVRALDATGAPLAGMAIGLQALEEPDDLLAKESWRKYRRERVATTDAEGQAVMPGLHPIDVAITAKLRGPDSENFLISLRGGDGEATDVQPLRVSLVEGEETALEVRVRPAARVHLHLDPDCAGITRETEAIVVSAGRLAPDLDDPEVLLRNPVLTIADAPRSGPDLLELELGPLAAGRYVIAVRPKGFERWTLWPGTEIPFEAEAVEGIEGDLAPLESFPVSCAPIAELRLKPPDGVAMPDMRLATAQATWTSPRPDVPPVTLSARALPTHVRLASVPRGAGTITAELVHPHLLPTDRVTFSLAVDARDGSLSVLEAPIAGVGGALVVTTTAPAIALRRDGAPPGASLVAATYDSRVEIHSLPAGPYLLDECSDLTCSAVVRTLPLEILALRTTTLP